MNLGKHNNTRQKRAKTNIIVSFFCQILTVICGIIVPRLLLRSFGSEAYGAVTSITQFLAYITLLEGGVAVVARAALYKPLADNDIKSISVVVSEIKRFFRIVALIFLFYVIILASTFKTISNTQCFDWITTALLVLVISASTFAQYFFGISNLVLLIADQRTYITSIVSASAIMVNAIVTVVLINAGANLLVVKAISGVIFMLRPVIFAIYVKKRFKLVKVTERNKDVLKQKWTCLGQHIAYFLYSNTDIAVLTIMSGLKWVSVYSVYNLVISNVQGLTSTFSSGMEALFGDMIAKKEIDKLLSSFDYYETLLSIVSTILFSCTAVLTLPFVVLYTKGVTDANYVAPLFLLIMSLSAYVSILRIPYYNVTIAAGAFKDTRVAAYGEAFLNIILSVLLVKKYGLIGVAIGTLVATSFRFAYYAIYLSQNIIMRSSRLFVKRCIVNAIDFSAIYFIGKEIVSLGEASDFVIWIEYGLLTLTVAVIITIVSNYLLYKNDVTALITRILIRRNNRHVTVH